MTLLTGYLRVRKVMQVCVKDVSKNHKAQAKLYISMFKGVIELCNVYNVCVDVILKLDVAGLT